MKVGYRVELELEPITNPGVWTDISADVLGYTITRGRDRLTEDFRAGELTGLVLDNSEGDYDPDYEDGPHWPNIKPNRAIRVFATTELADYPRFHGFVNEWPSTWDVAYAETVVSANDGPKQLLRRMRKSVWERVVEAEAPVAWYRLGETSGAIMRDRVAGNDGSYEGGATFNSRPGLVAGDLDPCISFSGPDMSARVERPALGVGSGAFTELMFIRLPTQVLPQGPGGENANRALMRVPNGNEHDWIWRMQFNADGTVSLSIRVGDVNPFTNFHVAFGPYPRDGARHMVVVRRTAGGELKLHRDRALLMGSDTGVTNARNPLLTFLGQSANQWGSANEPLDIEIDDCVQFDRALTFTGDVPRLYDAATRPWAGDTTAERAHRILDAAEWPAADRAIGDGRTLLDLDGFGAKASTPDHPSLDTPGDLDLRIAMAPVSWKPPVGVLYNVFGKWADPANKSYFLELLNSGHMRLIWASTGTNFFLADSTVKVVTGAQQDGIWWGARATLDVNNGAGGRDITFYRKPLDLTPGAASIRDQLASNSGWEQRGAVVTQSGTTSIFSGTGPLSVGFSSSAFEGHVLAAVAMNGIGGTVVADPDFTQASRGDPSVTDSTGKVWTLDEGARLIALGFGVAPAELVGRTPTGYLHALARSEFGGFYMGPDGKARLRTRYELATTPKVTISDLFDDPAAPAALFYSTGVRDSASDRSVRNDVRVTPAEGPDHTERDQASIDEYRLREKTVATLHHQRGTARHVARLHLEPEPLRGMRSVSFRLHAFPDQADAILGCELEDRATWRAHPPPEGRPALTADAFVQQITDVVTRSTYEVAWTLASVPSSLP